MTELCPCGKPLHYNDPAIQEAVQRVVDHHGTHVTVRDSRGRCWRVPRHFIALHGLREEEVSRLGFARSEDLPA